MVLIQIGAWAKNGSECFYQFLFNVIAMNLVGTDLVYCLSIIAHDGQAFIVFFN